MKPDCRKYTHDRPTATYAGKHINKIVAVYIYEATTHQVQELHGLSAMASGKRQRRTHQKAQQKESPD